MASIQFNLKTAQTKLRICMVSDFFYPGLGGVETHIYQLSEALMLKGLKVIVVTRFSGNRHGIRYMANGLKVYYLPTIAYLGSVVWPSLFDIPSLFRQILIRERIDIVHGHQTTSILAMQCLFHAKTLNRRAIYTEHSLFGFDDAASIHLNKAQKLFHGDLDHAICVSHSSRENFVLRNRCDPLRVSVINNAVDTTKFFPDLTKRPPPPLVNIVVISRLTYRKGVDLLIQLIPLVCKRHANINFIIGGDGNKRNLLEEMRDTFELRNRVTFLGAVPHQEVCSVLQMGHIFLSCSLSEAFCIAILEAMACGLIVVSTNVGGVSEVLPASAAILEEPDVGKICSGLEKALKLIPLKNPYFLHRQIAETYSWHDVACRTEAVYNFVMDKPPSCVSGRLYKVYESGFLAGKLYTILVGLDYVFQWALNWIFPRRDIDEAPDFPVQEYIMSVKDSSKSTVS